MSEQMESRALLKSYLLERLAPGDKDAFEKRLFEDNDLIESLALVEEELIEGYLSKTLSPRDAESFESTFLIHPIREEHVQLIERLKQIGLRNNPPYRAHPRKQFSSRFLRVAAAFVLLAISVSVWFFSMHDRSTPTAKDGKNPTQERSNAVISAPIAKKDGLNASNDEAVFKVHLDSPVYRGPGSKPAIVVSSRSVIEFSVKVSNRDYSVYRVTLQTVERKLALQTTVPNPKHNDIRFTVPAAELADSDYIITVQGLTLAGELDSAGEYFIRIKLRD